MARTTTYADAGVSLDANARWVARIQSAMRSTHDKRVVGREGAFAGLFRLDLSANGSKDGQGEPVLVGCADGVGTKLLLAVKAKRLRGIGIDLVAMNVNDLITCGAEPLFFLDYLAVHKIEPDGLAEIVEGMADGCRQAGCAFLGGETAEMPDLYKKGHLDLAGFATGMVEGDRIIDGHRVKPGDVLVGLASNGIHSNGYTLVRRLFAEHRLKLHRRYEELGETMADAVLRPTRIYVASVMSVLKRNRVKRPITGMAHITGGGLRENVARMLPPGCVAEIDTRSWTPPLIFSFIQALGIQRREMYSVFNMGIGFVLAVKPALVSGIMRGLKEHGESPNLIGQIKPGRRTVQLK